MATPTVDLRQLAANLAAALVCLWTGYFLCHTWQTLDTVELALLFVAVACCYGGASWYAA